MHNLPSILHPLAEGAYLTTDLANWIGADKLRRLKEGEKVEPLSDASAGIIKFIYYKTYKHQEFSKVHYGLPPYQYLTDLIDSNYAMFTELLTQKRWFFVDDWYLIHCCNNGGLCDETVNAYRKKLAEREALYLLFNMIPKDDSDVEEYDGHEDSNWDDNSADYLGYNW